MTMNVLIAESDAALREDFAEFFRRRGFQIETAAGGVECVAKVRHQCPDILIVDHDLRWGGADGVLARLGEDSSLPLVPLVIGTGDERPSVLSAALGLPAVRCFQKPFRLTDLLGHIESTLRRLRENVAAQS